MYTKEDLGRMNIWCHSLKNVIDYINISKNYSNPIDWQTGDYKMIYTSLLSSAIINWGQVFSIGNAEEGFT